MRIAAESGSRPGRVLFKGCGQIPQRERQRSGIADPRSCPLGRLRNGQFLSGKNYLPLPGL